MAEPGPDRLPGRDTVARSAALERAAKLTEANAALRRSLDVLASETDVDRLLGHILGEIGGRLGAQRIALWLSEGDLAPTVDLRIFWTEDGRVQRPVDEALGSGVATVLMDSAPRFRELRRPLSRPVGACDYLDEAEARTLRDAGVEAILHLPLLMGDCVLGAMAVLFSRSADIPVEDLDLVQSFVHQATLAIRLAQLSTEAQNAAISRERARMSREIHDTIAQSFIGIIRHLGGRDGRPPDIPVALSLASSGLVQARRAVAAMRPSLLEGRSFIDALQDLAARSTRDGLHAVVRHSGSPIHLMPESEGELFRIVEEAVQNVARHARATEVGIDVSFLPGEITILVSDDGRGFDMDASAEDAGFGLYSMKQRAQAIGGELAIVSAPGRGTQVYVSWRATAASQE